MRLGCAAAAALLAGCSTTTIIRTEPPGAKVYLKDEYVGETPVQVKLRDGFLSDAIYRARIEKDGYEPQDYGLEQHYSVGLLILDGVVCLPTLGFGCYLAALNGQRHQDEYSVRLVPLQAPAGVPMAIPPPPRPGQ